MRATRDAGTDRWGMRVVEMRCDDCGYTVTVRRYVAEKGKRCPQCVKRKRTEASCAKLGIAVPHDEHRIKTGGSWLILEQRTGASRVSLHLADASAPTRHDVVSRCVFEFASAELAQSVRELLGPRVQDDFLTLACRIRDMHAALSGGMM